MDDDFDPELYTVEQLQTLLEKTRENRKLPTVRRAGISGIVGLALVWIPVLAYCTIAVGIDAVMARWR